VGVGRVVGNVWSRGGGGGRGGGGVGCGGGGWGGGGGGGASWAFVLGASSWGFSTLTPICRWLSSTRVQSRVIGLCCKRALYKRQYSAKETYNIIKTHSPMVIQHRGAVTRPLSTYMTHSYVRHDLFLCETWLIHTWDMTHSYVWYDSLSLSKYHGHGAMFAVCMLGGTLCRMSSCTVDCRSLFVRI